MSAVGGLVAILMLIQYAEAQTLHTVGDELGWRVPQNTSTYQNWASDKDFTVGDTLQFNFESRQHNVIQVSEESYNSCSSGNPIRGPWTNGPANITLNRAGPQYYICGVGQHCLNGQRLAIHVSESSSTTPPSTATPPPPPSSSSALTFIPFPLPLLCIHGLLIYTQYHFPV